MENVTIGQVAAWIAFIAAILVGGAKITASIKKWVTALLEDKFEEVLKQQQKQNEAIESLQKSLTDVDLENCKNYLVTYLAEIERGEAKDAIERERFWEEYGHYISKGGNSYIKEEVQRKKTKGLL